MLFVNVALSALMFSLNVLFFRSVLDMLQHLIGEKIPGIPYCEVISNDKQQRIDQVLQQHEAVLAFLRYLSTFCNCSSQYYYIYSEAYLKGRDLNDL